MVRGAVDLNLFTDFAEDVSVHHTDVKGNTLNGMLDELIASIQRYTA